MHSKLKAIVIGAGAGGTGVAAFLAKYGFDVTVFEKNSFVGGVCSSFESNGHRFDRGPCLFLYHKVYENVFHELDEEMTDHLEILETKGTMFYDESGNRFELTPNLENVCEQIKRFEGEEYQKTNVLQFFSECQNWVEFFHVITYGNYTTNFFDFRCISSFIRSIKWHIFCSIKNRVSKYFRHEFLRTIFCFPACVCGLSPNNAISPFNALVALLALDKYRYPKYGMQSVMKAIEKIASKKYGAKFIYNQSVTMININEENIATGVTLEDGSVINADVIVCNADIVYAYNNLLPKSDYGRWLAERGIQAESYIQYYWSLKRRLEELRFVQYFFPNNYFSSHKLYSDHNWSHKRVFSVFLPNRIDKTASPEGKDSVVVHMPIGVVDKKCEHNFKDAIKIARKYVIETIEKQLRIENFESFIENEIVIEPNEWTERFNIWNASMGLAMIPSQLLFMRPQNKSHLFGRLYFVGTSTKVGLSVHGNLHSSRLVAGQIDHDLNDRNNKRLSTRMIIIVFIVLIAYYVTR